MNRRSFLTRLSLLAFPLVVPERAVASILWQRTPGTIFVPWRMWRLEIFGSQNYYPYLTDILVASHEGRELSRENGTAMIDLHSMTVSLPEHVAPDLDSSTIQPRPSIQADRIRITGPDGIGFSIPACDLFNRTPPIVASGDTLMFADGFSISGLDRIGIIATKA